MTLTLCGSIAFLDQILQCQEHLERKGHTVFIPAFIPHDSTGKEMTLPEFYAARKSEGVDLNWLEHEKSRAIREHFEKIERADAVLIVNEEKNSVPGYIGGNTLMEMALAFHLRKPIYLLHQIPELSYTEEVIGMQPILLQDDLSNLP